MAAEPFTFDPKLLITGPFHPCPRCGKVQLGTLSVSDNVHARRCRSCFHDEREPLPPLDKKLIYLDQMVLSQIAKKLDPVWRREKPHTDDFWLEAFCRIDRLVKLQLIVCPDSPIHEVESSFLEPYEPALRRLYKHLASGVSLRFPHEVLSAQLHEAFDAWFADRDPDWSRITRDDVIRGRLDRWSDRLLLTVNMGHLPGQIEGRCESRARGHEALQRLWKQWTAEEGASFDDFFRRERRGLADTALQSFMIQVQRWQRAVTNVTELADPGRLMPGWRVLLVTRLLNRLEESEVPREDLLEEAASFLYSEQAMCAPENHLAALLYASLAWRAASGQKRVPSQGTPNDIDFISAYLPYCDAMFIDNEFAQLLSEGRLAEAVSSFPTRIFSARSRDDFLAYLTEVEERADSAHVDLVTRTYGEKWTEPYRSILEHERGKGTRDRL
ncbi:hypothetical protein [Candidatus Palauibacter sp.]|uniref:hypothetical protein n=1 Tax=Candidatus Palauibacter sp. TaxID=3101350 RepID=UPI003B5B1F8B